MEKINENKKKCEEGCCQEFSWQNGFKFGLGFTLALALGWAVVAILVWLIFLTGSLL